MMGIYVGEHKHTHTLTYAINHILQRTTGHKWLDNDCLVSLRDIRNLFCRLNELMLCVRVRVCIESIKRALNL